MLLVLDKVDSFTSLRTTLCLEYDAKHTAEAVVYLGNIIYPLIERCLSNVHFVV